MVKLNFNGHGFEFQYGVKTLRASFQSAAEALAANAERAKEEAVDYQESVDHGGDWIGERDEEGYVIWDHADVLNWNVKAAEEASMALRKALVIALYHHWERSARVWTCSTHINHDDLVSCVQAKGVPIDPRLVAIRDLVNALKHGNDRWGNPLRKSWSAVFSPNFQPCSTETDWYEVIRLMEDHVLEAFDIVSASGPTSTTF